MIIKWRYSQIVELIELDLCEEQMIFKVIQSGANDWGIGELLKVDISKCRGIPDLSRMIELLEEQFKFYLYD